MTSLAGFPSSTCYSILLLVSLIEFTSLICSQILSLYSLTGLAPSAKKWKVEIYCFFYR